MIASLRRVLVRWKRDEASLHAAALSYYLALSLFPLLLILMSAMGAFFKWTDSGRNAREYLIEVISNQVAVPLATAVDQSLMHVQDYSPVSGPVGMAILLGSALMIFSQFERAFDRMWNVQRPSNTSVLNSAIGVLTHRLRAFAMLCAVAGLLVLVFAAGMAISAVQSRIGFAHVTWVWWIVEVGIELGINALAFATLYRFLPKVPVQWKHALAGGVLAAVIWEIGRQSIATFLIGQHYSSAYGVIGGFLAIMIWGYYAVAVIFFAAEFVQVLGEGSTEPASETHHQQSTLDAHAKRSSTGNLRANKKSARKKPAAVSGTRPPWTRSIRASLFFDLTAAALMLYIGLFLGLRHFRVEDVDVHSLTDTTSARRFVQFSDNPRRHHLAKRFFAPLIATLPGPYRYDLDEHVK